MPLVSEVSFLGPAGEDIAVRYLQKKGLRIIYRNYKTPVGEADIVAGDKETIVFVEVKTRSSEKFGEPFEAVTSRKREKLKKIALYYQKQQGRETPVRFDVISIKNKDDRCLVEHIVEAF
jgi:putative endonuclease